MSLNMGAPSFSCPQQPDCCILPRCVARKKNGWVNQFVCWGNLDRTRVKEPIIRRGLAHIKKRDWIHNVRICLRLRGSLYLTESLVIWVIRLNTRRVGALVVRSKILEYHGEVAATASLEKVGLGPRTLIRISRSISPLSITFEAPLAAVWPPNVLECFLKIIFYFSLFGIIFFQFLCIFLNFFLDLNMTLITCFWQIALIIIVMILRFCQKYFIKTATFSNYTIISLLIFW